MKYTYHHTLAAVLFLCIAPSLQAQYEDCSKAHLLSTTEPYELPLFAAQPGQQELQDAPCRAEGLPELHTAWYSFQAAQPGPLAFELTPLQEGDDLDFVLYRMGNSCAEKAPLRCMAAGRRIGLDGAASAPCLGATGLKAEGEGEQAPPGCAGRSSNFLAPVNAEAGDRFLLAVTNYSSRHGFRLDWGGQLLLSPQLEVTAAFPLQLFPNPAGERLFLKLSLPAAKRVQVEVRDALGRRITTAAYDGAAGEQTLELPTVGWAPGLYWVSVVVDGVRVVEMVEKV